MPDTYYCHPCNFSILLPEELENNHQLDLVELSRSGRNIDTMISIRSKHGMGLGEAKFIAKHISKPKDHCSHCNNKLLEDGLTHCPSCSGLNFNW